MLRLCLAMLSKLPVMTYVKLQVNTLLYPIDIKSESDTIMKTTTMTTINTATFITITTTTSTTIRNIQHSNINITIGSTNKHIAIRTTIKK